MRSSGGCFLSRFRFAHTKRDVRQFQKTGATGTANLAVVPCAVAILSLKRKAGRDPQVFGKVFLRSRFSGFFPAWHPLIILAHPELDLASKSHLSNELRPVAANLTSLVTSAGNPPSPAGRSIIYGTIGAALPQGIRSFLR